MIAVSKILRADDYYAQGLEFVANRAYCRALSALSEALVLDARHERALYARGILYGQLGDDVTAIEDFTRLIALAPRNPLVYYMRGLSYRLLDDIPRALDDFSHVITLEPEHYDAYLQRAELYALAGLDGNDDQCLNRAIIDYDRVLALNPDELTAYKNRGLVRAVQGDNAGAIADCLRYLDGGGGMENGDHDDVADLVEKLRLRG